MRILVWLAFIAVLASVIYSGAQAGAIYLEARRLADESVESERPNLADTMLQGRWRLESKDYVTRVRERLVKGLAQSTFPVGAEGVTVSEEQEGVLTVTVRWSHPMLMLRGERYLVVPLSMTRRYRLDAGSERKP